MKRRIVIPILLLTAAIILSFIAASILKGQHVIGKGAASSITESITGQDKQKEAVKGPIQGATPMTSTGATAYIYGSHLVAQKSPTGTTYNFQDSIGSNTITTNQAGVIQSRFTAYPYGKPLRKESTNGGVQKFTFTGKEDDGHLSYFGARYLDHRTGRFISVDPALSTDASYDYADDNPIVMIDPDGRRVDYGNREKSILKNLGTGPNHIKFGRTTSEILWDLFGTKQWSPLKRELMSFGAGQLFAASYEIVEWLQYTRPLGGTLSDQYSLSDTQGDLINNFAGGVFGLLQDAGLPASLEVDTSFTYQHIGELRILGEGPLRKDINLKHSTISLQPYLSRGIYHTSAEQAKVPLPLGYTISDRSGRIGATMRPIKGPYLGLGMKTKQTLPISQGFALSWDAELFLQKGTGEDSAYPDRSLRPGAGFSIGADIKDWTKIFRGLPKQTEKK